MPGSSKLSFSHFIELIKVEPGLKRVFYETEAMVNNWSVRELQRAMDSMLFERTGLSKDKEAVLEKHRKGTGLTPNDIFRSPYMLDFLGLEEKAAYVETDLEGRSSRICRLSYWRWVGVFVSRRGRSG
jgi:predicted nuclease of restriction endonuclease-like (RecB) superfamily